MFWQVGRSARVGKPDKEEAAGRYALSMGIAIAWASDVADGDAVSNGGLRGIWVLDHLDCRPSSGSRGRVWRQVAALDIAAPLRTLAAFGRVMRHPSCSDLFIRALSLAVRASSGVGLAGKSR